MSALNADYTLLLLQTVYNILTALILAVYFTDRLLFHHANLLRKTSLPPLDDWPDIDTGTYPNILHGCFIFTWEKPASVSGPSASPTKEITLLFWLV